MENKIIHSAPVRDIMGTPPRKLVAWGTTILFIIFALFLSAAWFIQYPDTIPAQIEITTRKPPVIITARANGRITEMKVADSDTVRAGDVIAIIESSSRPADILGLEAWIAVNTSVGTINPQRLPAITGLGEVQQFYSAYSQAYSRLWHYRENDYLGHRIRSLSEEIRANKLLIESLKAKERLHQDGLQLEISRFNRDSLMFMREAISEAEYERSRQLLLARRIDIQQMSLDVLEESISISRKEQDLQELSIRREEELQELSAQSSGRLSDLIAAIDMWKNKYILQSPVDGTITFTRYWSVDQYVYEGEQVLTVVPADQGEIFGRVMLGMQRSGKVKKGLSVNIKLSGYPHMEYGLVRGIISNISQVADEKQYSAEISLPDGLKTIYGKELPFTQNMSGTVEILTDDMRLLQKIVDPLKYLISKNRSLRTNQPPE
ncbi:MAG: HlyD family efflux transporter periplasmic adaptor subunit [Bacteroidales bacterium]